MNKPEDYQPPFADGARVSEAGMGSPERDIGDTAPATPESVTPDSARGDPSGITRPLDATPATQPIGPRAHHFSAISFLPGQILTQRYRIVRFIGQGGMGEVYEAEDLELRERVALKTIRLETATDQQALERFKREIHLARKVTHPNVCRIFDLQYHGESGSGGREGMTSFLTMELLEGETLSQRLARVRRITPAEALPLVAQMSSGLAAAHRAGIVHRDFKSPNVILVPSNDYEGGTRVVITDFGLARLSATAETSMMTLSLTGDIAGTPAYMAPEQVRGEDLTPAADIYALGVVLYELITGSLPFKGDTPLSIAVKRLEQNPPPPRSSIPDLDLKWDAAILRCLERNPLDRFSSAQEVVKAISGEVVTQSKPVQPAGLRRRGRYVAAGLAVALALALGLGYRLYVKHATATAGAIPAAATVARSVAVLDLKNTSGRESEAWLSEDLARTLSDDLSVGNQLVVIPTREVLQAAHELHLTEIDMLSAQSLAELKQRLSADYIVSGSYLALGKQSGGQVRVELRLLDTASGNTLASIKEQGTEKDIFALLGRPSDRLRHELGVPRVTASEAADVFASIPANPDAARPYSEGLKRLHLFDTLGAIPLLQKAIAAAPDYPLIHADLAGAWADLGYDSKAREEAGKAFDLSANLSPDKRSLIEGRYRETIHDWDKAVEIYRTLWIRFPEQPEFGFRLAAAQTAAGKGKDALTTLDGLRKLRSPQNLDPHIEIQEAEAYETLSDYRAERNAASQAVDLAKKNGSQLLLARARLMDCWASLNLGEPKRAKDACEDARKINESLGNQSGVARSVSIIASALANEGDIAGAKKMFEAALAITQRIGDKNNMQGALNNLANMLFAQGEFGAADKFYEQGLAVAQDRGNKVESANLLNNIAGVYHAQGRLTDAERKYDQALATAVEIDNKATVARVQFNLAMLLAERGELGGAISHYQESLSMWNKLGSKSEVAGVKGGMGDVLLSQGDLTGAAKAYREALQTQTELGEKNNIAFTQLSLAQLSLEQGQVTSAEATFRQTAADFASQKDDDDEAMARAGLGRVLISEKRIADAQKEIQRAAELARKSANPTVRLTVAIASARLNAASAKYAAATKGLEATLAEANQIGLVGIQFESRLALGEVAISSGKTGEGRALLDLLKQEAAARGFDLIARKARAAQAGNRT